MTGPDIYNFRPATMDDLTMLTTWQAEPHVAAWWDDAAPFDAEDLADARVARWIVSHLGRPFGYMQDYTVHGWDDHHFFDLPAGSRGVDQYIGDAAYLGQGHGSGMIRQRMDRLFADGAPVIGTDPHPDNAHAIAVYTNLGFRPLRAAEQTRWGPILPMAATP